MSKRKSPPTAPDIAQFLTSSEHDNKHALTVYLEAIETDTAMLQKRKNLLIW